ncbi:MAG: hypothetical protein ACPG19_12980 [Saprospiraceae bacterium]
MANRFSSALINSKLPTWKIKMYDFILALFPFLAIGRTNRLVKRFEHLMNIPFMEAVVKDQKINVIPVGNEHIPKSGAVTIVSNHPGGADVIGALIGIGRVRPDMSILANSLICIDSVKDLVIPVNMFARQKVNNEEIEEAYRKGRVVVFFAAGKNSRYTEEGLLRDRRWRTTYLSFAAKYNTPIHVMRIEDKNSPIFYKVSKIRQKIKQLKNVPLENMFQLREFTRSKSALKVFISKPTYLTDLEKTLDKKALRTKADAMHDFVYQMNENNLEYKNKLN